MGSIIYGCKVREEKKIKKETIEIIKCKERWKKEIKKRDIPIFKCNVNNVRSLPKINVLVEKNPYRILENIESNKKKSADDYNNLWGNIEWLNDYYKSIIKKIDDVINLLS